MYGAGDKEDEPPGNSPMVLLGAISGSFQPVVITAAAGINIAQYTNFAIPATGDFNGDGLTDM